MTWPVDFADWADIPLAVNMDMSKVVTFEACFLVVGWLQERRASMGTLWMVPVVSSSWRSSACWRVNSVSGERGEEDAKGRGWWSVDVVISLMYRSTSFTNSGISNW